MEPNDRRYWFRQWRRERYLWAKTLDAQAVRVYENRNNTRREKDGE